MHTHTKKGKEENISWIMTTDNFLLKELEVEEENCLEVNRLQ